MRQAEPLLTDVVRFQSLEVLNGRFLAASNLFAQMMGSSRNVIGADFIMIDEGCGQVACLMTTCCDQIAGYGATLNANCGRACRPL